MTLARAGRPPNPRLTLAAARPCPDRILLPDTARGMGIFMGSTRGTGKSTLLGKHIAFSDFYRPTLAECVPVVIIDPIGGTIDNFLDKIGQEDYETRKKLFKRVRYVRIGGLDGRVIPLPIFSEVYPGERYSSRAQRLIDNIARVDKDLRTRPMLGM